MHTATKQGTQITPVTGLSTWFVVEFDDDSAELFNTWEAAMAAGQFETDDLAE